MNRDNPAYLSADDLIFLHSVICNYEAFVEDLRGKMIPLFTFEDGCRPFEKLIGEREKCKNVRRILSAIFEDQCKANK